MAGTKPRLFVGRPVTLFAATVAKQAQPVHVRIPGPVPKTQFQGSAGPSPKGFPKKQQSCKGGKFHAARRSHLLNSFEINRRQICRWCFPWKCLNIRYMKTRLASLHRPSLLFLGEVLNDTKKLICTFQRL